jgi:hypothetical protein
LDKSLLLSGSSLTAWEMPQLKVNAVQGEGHFASLHSQNRDSILKVTNNLFSPLLRHLGEKAVENSGAASY